MVVQFTTHGGAVVNATAEPKHKIYMLMVGMQATRPVGGDNEVLHQ